MAEVPTEPSFWITAVNFFVGAVGGIVTAVVMAMTQKNKLDNTSTKVNEISEAVKKIQHIDTLTEKVNELRNIIFKEKGGLSLLSVEDHTGICQKNQAAFGIEIENGHKALRMEIEQSRILFTVELNGIKEDISELKDDIGTVMATLNNEAHLDALNSMKTSMELNNSLMAEINEKLNGAVKFDRTVRRGVRGESN